MYLGMIGFQTFTIGPDGTKGTWTYEIDLEGILPDEFGTDVEITLYKTTDSDNNYVSIKEGSFVSTGEVSQEDELEVTGSPILVYGPVALENNEKIVLETKCIQVIMDIQQLAEQQVIERHV